MRVIYYSTQRRRLKWTLGTFLNITIRASLAVNAAAAAGVVGRHDDTEV